MSASRPRQVRDSVVVGVEAVGSYLALTLAADTDVPQPGQFAALAVGGQESPMLLRRCFSLTDWREGTLTVVFSVAGRGTAWLADRRPGDRVDLVAPLGRPFVLRAGASVLVGGGYGAAPLGRLAAALAATGAEPHVLLGAAGADRLLGVEMEAASVTVTTDDGSAGSPGRVTSALPSLLRQTGAETVYACGPMPMLRAVAEVALAAGVECQVSVEEAMACGVGVCMTCVLPVVGVDGVTRMTRACFEGPVFDARTVRFDAAGRVPADALGAG